ncbi:MAG: response regulator [Amylibacter sp.]|nr:response regulator [Amylibacter sp.]
MRILSVDDDPIILELLAAVLVSMGHTDVTTAESATEAFEIIKDDPEPFDCFLLDIQMPGIDGIQLCKALRLMPEYKRTPILMITAMSDKGYIERAFAAGATDYVTKPFDIVELGARVKVAEALVDAWRVPDADAVANADQTAGYLNYDKPYGIEEKFPVHDVEGVIDYIALENYVSQLSRGMLFGSSVFAFSIVEIDRIFNSTSAFDFEALITDVAEAITFCLKRTQHLVAYAGNGTFVCSAGAGKKIEPGFLKVDLREIINEMGLCSSDGRSIVFSVELSKMVGLTFRSNQNVIKSLSEVRQSARNKADDLLPAGASMLSLAG